MILNIEYIINKLYKFKDNIYYKNNNLLGKFIRCNKYNIDPDGFHEISLENTGIRYVLIFDKENIIIDSNNIDNIYLSNLIISIKLYNDK
jgi:hypothetical protein